MRNQSNEILLGALNGSAQYLGSLALSGSAALFNTKIQPEITIMIQAVGDCYILPYAAGSQYSDGSLVPTVSDVNGILLLDGEKFMMTVPQQTMGFPSTTGIQGYSAAGTLKFFKLE